MHNWYQNCIFIKQLKPNVMDNVKVNFKGSPVTLVGTHLQTGDKAPRFTVLDGDLQPVSLSQYKDKNLIISVFPSVDTSVCALQNIRFNKEASKLKRRCRNPFDFGGPALCTKTFLRCRRHRQRACIFRLPRPRLRYEVRLRNQGTEAIGPRRNRNRHKKGIIRYIEYVPEIAQEPNYEAALKAVKELE